MKVEVIENPETQELVLQVYDGQQRWVLDHFDASELYDGFINLNDRSPLAIEVGAAVGSYLDQKHDSKREDMALECGRYIPLMLSEVGLYSTPPKKGRTIQRHIKGLANLILNHVCGITSEQHRAEILGFGIEEDYPSALNKCKNAMLRHTHCIKTAHDYCGFPDFLPYIIEAEKYLQERIEKLEARHKKPAYLDNDMFTKIKNTELIFCKGIVELIEGQNTDSNLSRTKNK
ncbi:hypothetical protein [uncultured Photobacterium sp.]|uniref:hypothetical protein n=1 Tax=uncultured Photobacterium sp. TaxID=173973 RepID=UPI00262FF023|nr:hypothetical protein [uncultured Photobacterium sp.]